MARLPEVPKTSLSHYAREMVSDLLWNVKPEVRNFIVGTCFSVMLCSLVIAFHLAGPVLILNQVSFLVNLFSSLSP